MPKNYKKENDLYVQELIMEWDSWGDTKPWHCSVCDSLLASDEYQECDGTKDLPEEYQNPHKLKKATAPISFEEFCKIRKRWNLEY